MPSWRACHLGRLPSWQTAALTVPSWQTAILTGSRHGAALKGRSQSATLAVPLRQDVPLWQCQYGRSVMLAPQDVVVQVLQNAAKSSICGLQNAKSVAKCKRKLAPAILAC